MKSSAGLRWILRESRPAAAALTVLAVSSAAGSAVNLLTTVILKAFTDYAAGDSTLPLGRLAAFSAVLLLLGGLFLILDALGFRLACHHTERSLRIKLTNAISRAELLAIQQYHSGELLTRLTKDAETVSCCLPQLLRSLLGGCLSAIGALIYMLYLSWQLTLAILLALPLLLLLIRLFSPVLEERTRTDRQNEEAARTRMQDILDRLSLLQVYQAQPLAIKQLQTIYRRKQHSVRSLGLAEGCFQFLNTSTGLLTFLLAMGFGAYLTVHGTLTVGGMIAVINLLNMVTWPLSNISASLVQIRQATVSAERMDEVLRLPSVQSRPCAAEADSLLLKELCFAYPDAEPLLKGISACFRKGTITCITGPSGCGKSTLLNILMGLYPPSDGSIAPENPRVSYVPCDHALYTGTVRENILMGAPEDAQRMEECLLMANAAFVHTFPQGMETLVGSGGYTPSSGQAQRIAIARALYRPSQVLILDEPTSNLDQVSTSILIDTLHSLANDLIVLVVSHDPLLIEACDVKYRLEEGKLV